MAQSNKERQRTRMWEYFIDAATDVVLEQGIEQMTIRKVADLAGYTSSTAYNYFNDLSQLKFYAALRFTKPYSDELPIYLKKGQNTLEKWLYAWECFCKHSFQSPHIYATLFIDNIGGSAQTLLDQYYTIFPNDLSNVPDEIRSLLTEESFAKRSEQFIEPAVDEGFVEARDIQKLADLTFMVWTGTMMTFINNRRNWTKYDATNHTLKSVRELVLQFTHAHMREHIQYRSPNLA
ncbi:transcriptional regulator, TetR family [Pelagirhabdus alkalitolerans]|uniref:Transcriptional regulator, TetR family n=1 Tax=Pelagirhabdus alkalitolerans TaxID=1612202 RepID=A0A1G6L366_9BACI|nr:TetR/AcrR family transcriptional regulator [Pelagirhabdus alkalitolerans]SDC37165.1 transcriptional regulator, TetR family [Pelagirhabdus alkalitolerans]